MSYHYGQTIKEYRIANKMTLEQLASRWPSKETGVNIRYVIDVEAGKKRITDIEVIRKLASMLNIPLWKFGLSEYNPFSEENVVANSLVDLNSLLELIENTWYIRLYMPAEITEQKIASLANIFARLIHNNPRILNNTDFLVLYAQVKRLQEVVYTERHNYKMSLQYSQEMSTQAKQSGDSISQSIALTRIGVELLRAENLEALNFLEKARDVSFTTSSKEVAAYCYSFLARAYATFKDERRFIQAINTAITLADIMKGQPIVTKDYIFHAYSAVIEEKVNGLIMLGRGKEALNELHELELQIVQENNAYLKMWIPLDYAQSFMAMGEIETSVQWLETFYDAIKMFKSARIHSKIKRQLDQLDSLGYANLPVVKNFKNMYYEASEP